MADVVILLGGIVLSWALGYFSRSFFAPLPASVLCLWCVHKATEVAKSPQSDEVDAIPSVLAVAAGTAALAAVLGVYQGLRARRDA